MKTWTLTPPPPQVIRTYPLISRGKQIIVLVLVQAQPNFLVGVRGSLIEPQGKTMEICYRRGIDLKIFSSQ